MTQESFADDGTTKSSPVIEALKGMNAAAGEALSEMQRELQSRPRDPLQLAIAMTRGRLTFLRSLAKQIQSATDNRP